jgi:hypothetical protein
LHRERWGAQFEAMRLLLPEADTYRAAVTDADFVEAFATALVRRFIAGLRVLDNAPELELFAERNAGMMILYSLALAAAPGDTFPPEGPVSLSINALATRFSVSRKHVLTLLRDAEGQGLLMRGGAGNNEVTLLPRGREALEQLVATIFLYLAQCADEALRGRAKDASSFAMMSAGG